MDKTKTLELLKKKSHAVTNQDVDYLFSANKSKQTKVKQKVSYL